MSNECQRVVTLHALTEIRRILQIEENISVSRQTLTYAGRGMVAVISSRITVPRKVQVNISTNLQKNSSISNRIDQEAIKCHLA